MQRERVCTLEQQEYISPKSMPPTFCYYNQLSVNPSIQPYCQGTKKYDQD